MEMDIAETIEVENETVEVKSEPVEVKSEPVEMLKEEGKEEKKTKEKDKSEKPKVSMYLFLGDLLSTMLTSLIVSDKTFCLSLDFSLKEVNFFLPDPGGLPFLFGGETSRGTLRGTEDFFSTAGTTIFTLSVSSIHKTS
jgi:hypothetical protein